MQTAGSDPESISHKREGNVILGDGCDIAPEVCFVTGSHRIGDTKRRAGDGTSDDIVVSSGTWIGTRACLAGRLSNPGAKRCWCAKSAASEKLSRGRGHRWFTGSSCKDALIDARAASSTPGAFLSTIPRARLLRWDEIADTVSAPEQARCKAAHSSDSLPVPQTFGWDFASIDLETLAGI